MDKRKFEQLVARRSFIRLRRTLVQVQPPLHSKKPDSLRIGLFQFLGRFLGSYLPDTDGGCRNLTHKSCNHNRNNYIF